MLENFLNTKPLYYNEIDYTRMPRVYKSIQKSLKLPKIIHVIGTNGKGTTGRFLAKALFAQGYGVGHYTSPHITEFRERIWLNGADVSDERLESAHTKLLSLLTQEDADALSYFEYTTLLAMLVYEDVEYVVLEAGLGGEHDATAVFENVVTVVTPIAKDHEAFLGSDIEAIATTKLNAVQKYALLAKQPYAKELLHVQEQLEKSKNIHCYSYAEFLTEEDYEKIETIAKKSHLAPYLKENLSLAVAALSFLKLPYSVEDFQGASLFGRLTQLSSNVLLDVGHNPLAAEAIAKTLQGEKYILIYNSFKDKDYEEVLRILKPIVQCVELISVEDSRALKPEEVEKVVQKLGLESREFKEISSQENYLVFGSFSVAEAFLKVYNG